MGRVAVVNFVTLDGVIQSPTAPDEDPAGGFAHGGWILPYSDETVDEFMRGTTVGAAGLLVGRRSYQILAHAWSDADKSDAAVAAMNRMPKYVVSASLAEDELSWVNSHRVGGSLPTAVADLKHQVTGEIVVFGSGELIQGLAEHDLIDEYRLLIFPVVLGAGKRMFGNRSALSRFALYASSTSPSGVMMLSYGRTVDRSTAGPHSGS